MTPMQAVAASGPIAAATTIVAQSAVEDGLSKSSAWSVGLIVGGLAVFRVLDRRAQKEAAEHAELRRSEDKRREERVAALEARIELLQSQHAAEVGRLTDRIIALLQEGNK